MGWLSVLHLTLEVDSSLKKHFYILNFSLWGIANNQKCIGKKNWKKELTEKRIWIPSSSHPLHLHSSLWKKVRVRDNKYTLRLGMQQACLPELWTGENKLCTRLWEWLLYAHNSKCRCTCLTWRCWPCSYTILVCAGRMLGYMCDIWVCDCAVCAWSVTNLGMCCECLDVCVIVI